MREFGRNNEQNYLTLVINCYCVSYMNPGRFLSRSSKVGSCLFEAGSWERRGDIFHILQCKKFSWFCSWDPKSAKLKCLTREIKVLQNKVSWRKRKIKMQRKKPLKTHLWKNNAKKGICLLCFHANKKINFQHYRETKIAVKPRNANFSCLLK